MAKLGTLEAKVRKLCLSLADTIETAAWGHPNFKVSGCTFASLEAVKGVPSLAVRLAPPDKLALACDPRFFDTPYGAKQGWISLRLDTPVPWRLIADLLRRAHAFGAANAPRVRPASPARGAPASRNRSGRPAARVRRRPG